MILAITGCTNVNSTDQRTNEITYYKDTKQLIDQRCTNCHAEGNVGFPLTQYDDVVKHKNGILSSVTARRMPIWPAASGHQTYMDDPSLTDENIATLKKWIEAGLPKGHPDQYQPVPDKPLALAPFEPDVDLELIPGGAPYLPNQNKADDYRCFMLEWPLEDPVRYLTGFQVEPGNDRVVHHLVAYKVSRQLVPMLTQLDSEEEGLGYRCFGGALPDRLGDEGVEKRMEKEFPGLLETAQDQTMWLFHWAPGMEDTKLPAETGLPIGGDDVIVVQMHYYSGLAKGEADMGTRMLLETKAEVRKPAFVFPLTENAWFGGKFNKSMVIPPGEEATFTSTATFEEIANAGKQALGIDHIKSLEIHSVNLHMHSFGTATNTTLQRQDGSEEMLLEIKEWNLHWQRDYMLEKPITIDPKEFAKTSQSITCHFANPTKEPVYGGLGSDDEMCMNFSIYALDHSED
jgi:hypothetical protein